MTLQLDGDAHLWLVAPVETAAVPVRAGRDARSTVTQLCAAGPWETEGDGSTFDDLLNGSLTYEAREADLLHRLDYHGERQSLDPPGDVAAGGPAWVADVSGLVFPDGSLSVAAHIVVPDGWSDDARGLRPYWAPTRRDRTADAVREVLLGLLPIPSTLPYFHGIAGGVTELGQPGCASLDDSLRCFVYPDRAEPLKSMSPLLDEFVFCGYAFTLMAITADDADPARRMTTVVRLVQVVQSLYRRLAVTCDRAEEGHRQRVSDDDLDELFMVELEVQRSYLELTTPTFTFDHRILVLRDALLGTWRVADLVERAEFLLRSLRTVESRRQAARTRKWQRLGKIALAVLTVLSLFEIADSTVSLADRFSWTNVDVEQAE